MKRAGLCVECKGRGFCGLLRCPVVSRFHAKVNMKPVDNYMGESPSVFVGSYGYPNVSGGPLMIQENDNPEIWVERGYSIDDVVSLRSRTIRGTAIKGRLEDNIQEVALSSVPVDVEVAFEKPVNFDLKFDGTLAPVGLSGDIKKMDILDNASVARIVDKITSDTDLKATEGIYELYKGGVDVHRIQNILTAGLLGTGSNRHIVPTKWGITAIDDTVSKRMKSEVMKYPPLEDVLVFTGMVHANRIICLLVPGDWKYEMVEIWEKNSLWSGDSEVIVADGENKKNKSKYSPIAGAYYSGRLAVLEYLSGIRRCARVIVVRQVTGEYWAPLGTWVIREAARAAMKAGPLKCENLNEGINSVSKILGSDKWLANSGLVHEIKTQKTLFDF
ncbi:hypothetical protein F1737_00980 [Methanoplanus sp. FWC-SCC4]|uniref:DNA repair protein n=1 Tax=Methanochimaera problematica TaxID=2609417 RepID=A0AA97FC62_9EURY|nr:hypothetical protein [Methanoplanus sp. FWC-SCC4]WOF15353.1 hypothetical protein F1737_00980 [Methanoplanus sp. FWC-SCC4]